MGLKEREVMLCGVPMAADQDTFIIPKMPGWKCVAQTRGTFGAKLIYEKVKGDQDGDEGETGKQD